MKKTVREYQELVTKKEVIYICDKCRCEIDNPLEYGKRYNKVYIDSDLNYPDHGGCETKYELCEDCFNIIEQLLIKEIKNKYE